MLKGITEWRRAWERAGWLTAAKKPVANLEYWKKLFALVDKLKVTTQWVRGHNGHVHNERCDTLADETIAEGRHR